MILSPTPSVPSISQFPWTPNPVENILAPIQSSRKMSLSFVWRLQRSQPARLEPAHDVADCGALVGFGEVKEGVEGDNGGGKERGHVFVEEG